MKQPLAPSHRAERGQALSVLQTAPRRQAHLRERPKFSAISVSTASLAA